jgi:integrase
VKIGFDLFTGCLSSHFGWSVTLSPEVSRRIRDYRPRLPRTRWEPVADQVKATVAAAAPATGYEAGHLLHVVGRLAVWADGGGLPRDPGVWLRTETIDAFVLSGCAGKDGSTVQTYRSWLRRVREALVWVQRGEAPPARLSSPRNPQPPYESAELSRLRAWAAHLPGQARLDGLAMMALGAGCGLTPGEIRRVRGSHIRVTSSGVAVLDQDMLGRLVACHTGWGSVLAELSEGAGAGFLFRPGRKVAAAKNLVSSWPKRHRPHAGLPLLSARRLRSTWIVRLLADGISPAVVAKAAGMSSTAALAPYHRWVPPLSREEVIRLLHGRRR